MENHYSNDLQSRGVTRAQKLMFFAIGGGIGAATALLFAPKSGRELRRDAANLVDRGYDKALVAAGEIKDRTDDFYEVAKEAGAGVIGVISSRLSAVKDEVRNDLATVNSILQLSPICCTSPDTKTRYRLTETGRNIQEGAKQ